MTDMTGDFIWEQMFEFVFLQKAQRQEATQKLISPNHTNRCGKNLLGIHKLNMFIYW